MAQALETRTYIVKSPSLRFYCPLCRTKRAFRYQSKLKMRNWLHVALISCVLSIFTWKIMEIRIFIWPFCVLLVYEFSLKFMLRKEIPCPHCGFDATWYKRDVPTAKKLVAEFWKERSKNEKHQKNT